MRHQRSILFIGSFMPMLLSAQFAVNPQLGMTFQNLTAQPEGGETKAAVGFMLGLDLRIGDRFYFQPGAFFEQNSTLVTVDDTTVVEDNLIRSNLKLKALVGYNLIDGSGFRLRVNTGPSYDVLLGIKDKNSDDPIEFDKADFNSGSFNWNVGLGADISIITLETGVAYGLSDVFKEENVAFSSQPKYFTFYFTAGIVFGGAADAQPD